MLQPHAPLNAYGMPAPGALPHVQPEVDGAPTYPTPAVRYVHPSTPHHMTHHCRRERCNALPCPCNPSAWFSHGNASSGQRALNTHPMYAAPSTPSPLPAQPPRPDPLSHPLPSTVCSYSHGTATSVQQPPSLTPSSNAGYQQSAQAPATAPHSVPGMGAQYPPQAPPPGLPYGAYPYAYQGYPGTQAAFYYQGQVCPKHARRGHPGYEDHSG